MEPLELEEELETKIRRLEYAEHKSAELRCKHCAKLLAWNNPEQLSVDLKCHRCADLNSFYYDTNQQIYLTDHTGKILYVNEQVENITGYVPEEVLGKTPAVWGKQMPSNFYKNLWTEILHNKKTVIIRLTNRRKNGQLYKARTKIIPILNDKGKVTHFLAIQSLIEIL